MEYKRRTFLIGAAGAASALSASRFTFADSAAKVLETDPQAQALGYKTDATRADKVKFPKYAADQSCGNCQLYQGKPADTNAPCTLFQNRLVAAKGWCSAWVKKP